MPEPLPQTSDHLAALARAPFRPRQEEPVWKQIAARLREACGKADLVGRLPGETQMAETFGVTRVTMRRALRVLQNEGLLQARKGVGIFVRQTSLKYAVDHGRRFADGLKGMDPAQITTETLALATGAALPDEARDLGIAAGDPVIRLRRRRMVAGTAVYVSSKCFDRARFPDFEDVYARAQSVQDVFLHHAIPSYRRAETRVSGGFASEDEATALQLSPASPVLRVRVLNLDPEGRPIELNCGTWPLTAVELVLSDISKE